MSIDRVQGAKESLILYAIAAALSPATALAAPARPHMPQGAFLRRPARLPALLAREAHEDVLVRTRYARVFHLSPVSVPQTLGSLRLIRLPHDRILQVHYVTRGERFGYRVRKVRKGTPVYALPDGTPVLAQVCGNPLRPDLPLVSEMTRFRSEEDSEPTPDFAPFEPLPERGESVTFSPILRTARPPEAETGLATKTKMPPFGGGGGASGGYASGSFAIGPGFVSFMGGASALSSMKDGHPGTLRSTEDVLPPSHDRLPTGELTTAQAQERIRDWTEATPDFSLIGSNNLPASDSGMTDRADTPGSEVLPGDRLFPPERTEGPSAPDFVPEPSLLALTGALGLAMGMRVWRRRI